MPLKLIVLDCDGVLVDTEPLVAEILSASLSRYGLPTSPAEVDELFTGGTIDIVESESRARGAKLPENWQDEVYSEVFARFAEGVDVIPGIMDLISAAEARGIALAVASNGPTEKMRRSLGPSGLWDRLAPNIYSRVDYQPKPNPAMVLQAMQVACAEPNETVMIDDAPAGCRAGIAAGVRTFGFADHGQDQVLANVGAEVVNSIPEVMERLNLS